MIKYRYRQFLLKVIIFLVVLLSGCQGYHYAFDYNQIPDDVQTIAIPFFGNDTYESNIEAYFTTATMNEFIKNKHFKVVSQGGDATLSGVVKEFRTLSIAYSSQDRARQYRAFVTLEVTLRHNTTGDVLWRNDTMKDDEEYSVSETLPTLKIIRTWPLNAWLGSWRNECTRK